MCAPSPVSAAMSRAVPASPVTKRKSSCRPISFGTASRRSSTNPAAIAAAMSTPCGYSAIARSSKRLGAKQLLGQEHGDGVAALECHGHGRADRGHDLFRLLDAQADDAHRLQDRL